MTFLIGFSGNVPLKSLPLLLLFLTNPFHGGKIPSAWKTAIITPLPKKKCSSISENFSNLRPISVTSILSRLLEKVIIQRFLWPGLCEEGCLEDQFGFRPTGSTTAALIDITNFIYSKFNEGSDYVRCLLIDYSRAFELWIILFYFKNFVHSISLSKSTTGFQTSSLEDPNVSNCNQFALLLLPFQEVLFKVPE